jgi:hypothetical protein
MSSGVDLHIVPLIGAVKLSALTVPMVAYGRREIPP